MKTILKSSTVNKIFAFIVLFLILFYSGISTATIIEIDSSTSIIHTSGGIAGAGYGDLSISGSFNLEQVPLNLTGWDQLLFTDIDIVISEPGLFSPLVSVLPDSAAYNGTIFENGVSCVAIVGVICPTDNVSGTFDGTNFTMSRFYFSGIADDFSYEIIINGSVSTVPAPAAVWLLGSGLIALYGISQRRKHSLLPTQNSLYVT